MVATIGFGGSNSTSGSIQSSGSQTSGVGYRGIFGNAPRGSDYSVSPVAAPTAPVSPAQTAAVASTVGKVPVLNTSVGNALPAPAAGAFPNQYSLGRYGRNADVPQHRRNTPPTLPGFYTPIVPFKST
jgi:hypothetical protein